MDMPYYLLHSLKKMSMQVKKNKNKERSMYHHGFIKMLVESELNQRGQSWKISYGKMDLSQKLERTVFKAALQYCIKMRTFFLQEG